MNIAPPVCICGHSFDAHIEHDAEDNRAGLPRKCQSGWCNCKDYTAQTISGARLVDEAVDHPPHYGGDTVYEHIKVVNAWGLNYQLGNATKYICRAGKKDQAKAVEDLKKAVWYLEAEIKRRETEG